MGVVFREKVYWISRPFWYLCDVYFIIIITITFDIHPGVSPCQLKYFPIGLSPPSAISWGRSSPDRPSSSPSLNHTRRHLGTKQLARSPLTNNRFSRYMAKSVPDMKILSLEDPSWNRESEFFYRGANCKMAQNFDYLREFLKANHDLHLSELVF